MRIAAFGRPLARGLAGVVLTLAVVGCGDEIRMSAPLDASAAGLG